MARFLNEPLGENITSDPTERFDWSGLSMLANRAMQSRQIQHDRQILRRMLGAGEHTGMPGMSANDVLGPEPQAPASLSGKVFNALKMAGGVGRENQPISEIQKMVIEAKMKQMYQRPQRSVEDLIRIEEAKAGIRTTQQKQQNITRSLENYKKMANAEGLELNLDETQPLEKQLSTARSLFATKKGEVKAQKSVKNITPTTALGILSDPFKSQQLKRQYPELYKQVEKIVKDTFGEEVLKKTNTQENNNVMDTNW